MKESGFEMKSDTSFSAVNCEKEILISFDFENDICYKNQYSFGLEDYKKVGKEYYIKKETLETILNGSISLKKGHVVFNEIAYGPHEWLNYPRLIAHAGGGIRENGYISHLTNSLEALIQNYNLGQRVFEFDLYLTTDNKLACVHDWKVFGKYDGTWLSSEEWQNMKTTAYPINESRYTTMMMEDILDEMLVNKDMFLVTDTKSTEFTEEQMKLQFHLIYEEAMKRDPKLLDRIIPQIYNERMYDVITEIYPFKSIIYTTYANADSAQKIISFASTKDEIKVVTAFFDDVRFNENAIKALHSKNLLIFVHTVNQYEQLSTAISRDIDGFYTDLFLKHDLETCYKVIKNKNL